ncbi:hypothetical protein ACLBKU_00780 [Erythrobacter sp. NE805]|uniref:hypothetical protein n=1 Tax=Erythrobacter sp. NE805 TaxID=3389875 RepID=UPI00396AF0AB
MKVAPTTRSAVLLAAAALTGHLPARAQQPDNYLLEHAITQDRIAAAEEELSALRFDLESLWQTDRAEACATILPDYLRRVEALLADYRKSERLATRLALEGPRADAARKAQDIAAELAEAKTQLPALCAAAKK